MARPSERRDAAQSAPPVFADRTEAGVLLGAALREVLGEHAPGDEERLRVTADAAATPGGRGESQPCVFALPRGGVPVAVGVARALNTTVDALIVRKIGHPAAPELGLGAIAEDGKGGAAEPFFDQEMLDRVGLTREDLTSVVAAERTELARRVTVYGRRPQAGRVGSTEAAGAGDVTDDDSADVADQGGGPASDAPRTAGSAGVADKGGAPGAGGATRSEGGGTCSGEAGDLAGRVVIVVDDGLATGVTARAALRAVRARGAARTVLAVPVASPGAAQAMKDETDEVVTLVTPRRFRSVGEWYADFGQLTDADVLMLLNPSGETASRTPRRPPGEA